MFQVNLLKIYSNVHTLILYLPNFDFYFYFLVFKVIFINLYLELFSKKVYKVFGINKLSCQVVSDAQEHSCSHNLSFQSLKLLRV